MPGQGLCPCRPGIPLRLPNPGGTVRRSGRFSGGAGTDAVVVGPEPFASGEVGIHRRFILQRFGRLSTRGTASDPGANPRGRSVKPQG